MALGTRLRATVETFMFVIFLHFCWNSCQKNSSKSHKNRQHKKRVLLFAIFAPKFESREDVIKGLARQESGLRLTGREMWNVTSA
jgi:hypothetical protein